MLKKIKINDLTIMFLLIAFLCGYIKKYLIIFFIIIIHEFGHVFFSLLFKYEIISIELFPFGGLTKCNKLLNNSIYKDLLISFGGIIFQLILLLLCIINIINNALFYEINTFILLFNLIPIIPLDGSNILFDILNFFLSYEKAIFIYCSISVISIFLFFHFFYYSIFNHFFIISLFLIKTYSIIKNRKIIYQKFIIERLLYDIKYRKTKTGHTNIKKYQKDVKYYYYKNNKIIDEKEYLKSIISP